MKRVVVTGMGVVSPLGCGVDINWKKLIGGQSGIRFLDEEIFLNSPVRIAGVVPKGNGEGELLETNYLSPKDINFKKFGQFIVYAIAAAEEAISMAKWIDLSEHQKSRTGVIIGAGIGGLEQIHEASQGLISRNRVSTFFVPSSLINIAPASIAIRHGFTGCNSSVVTACASGADAIGTAFHNIRLGKGDVFIAGGAESTVTPLGIAGFNALTALAKGCESSPETASCPYDEARQGFVISEGSGVLVLEELDHAQRRGANILAEIVGYGASSDAYHVTAPRNDGYGAYIAMKLALDEANIGIQDVTYINGHGTSTPAGDLAEVKAVLKLFGEDFDSASVGDRDDNTDTTLISMSSTKSAIGHALGGAGGIEAAYVVQSLIDQVLPPTLNIKNPVTKKIDFIPRSKKVDNYNYAMSNSFGFGGTNACLVFKRWCCV